MGALFIFCLAVGVGYGLRYYLLWDTVDDEREETLPLLVGSDAPPPPPSSPSPSWDLV
jgi:hypothetical protein